MDLNAVKTTFDRDGFVTLPKVLSAEELGALKDESGYLIERGWRTDHPPQHYFHDRDAHTGEEVFHRAQFIFPKALRQPNPYLALLAHPQLLAAVEALHAGFHFFLSGEALVFKTPRNGRAVNVHCDGAEWRPDLPPREVFFNVDIYLDDSTPENGCLLAAPGSHLRPASALIREKGFDFPGLAPVPVRAGDAIIHNTRVVHGSHASRSPSLRRTIYYEFRTLEWGGTPEHARAMGLEGKDTTPWLRARTRLLQHAIALRRSCAYAERETPFTYRVPKEFQFDGDPGAPVDLAPNWGGRYF